MTFEIRRIPIWPVVKIFFVIYFIIIFLVTLLYGSMLANIVAGIGEMAADFSLPSFAALGMAGIVMLGLMFAFFGAVVNTALTAVVIIVYNAISSFMGGIELSTESGEWDTAQARMIRLEEAFASHSSKESAPVEEPPLEQPPQSSETVDEIDDDLKRFQPPHIDGDDSSSND